MYEQRQVDGHDTGAMWECPFLVPLSSEPPEAGNDGSPSTGPSTAADPADADPADADSFAPGASTQTYVLCVSPYPHHGPSTNSCLYWLGDYRDGRFDIDAADGATRPPTLQSLLTLHQLPCPDTHAASRRTEIVCLSPCRAPWQAGCDPARVAPVDRSAHAGPGRRAVRAQLLPGRRRAPRHARVAAGARQPADLVRLLGLHHAAARAHARRCAAGFLLTFHTQVLQGRHPTSCCECFCSDFDHWFDAPWSGRDYYRTVVVPGKGPTATWMRAALQTASDSRPRVSH